jgi:protein farnesyltransferase/geranylgeranyltransferase type-1 subunit alpha
MIPNFIRSPLSAFIYLLLRPLRALAAFARHLTARSIPETTKKSAKESKMPKYYHDDAGWADIEPLPQDDGGLHPLAAIAYSDEYSEAMGYLRAVMAKNEYSERVLELTEHIIGMNPAHYTVWQVA